MESTTVKAALVDALRAAATILPEDVVSALLDARERETSPLGAAQLDAILENVKIARNGGIPMCQDTGIQTFFVRAGVDSPFLAEIRGWLTGAVIEATAEIPLRPNTVNPLTGENPGDNTGAFMPYINWELVEGSEIEITVLPKGGGSENMSALYMLPPGVGLKGIKKKIVEHVVSAGGKPLSLIHI